MEALSTLGRNLFGFHRDKVEVVREEVGSRKRQLEEDVFTKDSLDPPVKSSRLANTPDIDPNSTTKTVQLPTSLVQSIFSTMKTWFRVKTSPDLVECSNVSLLPDTIQAAPPTFYSYSKLDTDEVELLMVEPNPPIIGSEAPTISNNKLATFSGFTKAYVHTHPHTSPLNSPHRGHSIRKEKTGKAELLPPPNIKRRMRSGLRSTFTKYLDVKNIAIWSGGIVKEKRTKQQNALKYSANYADRDVYKALLERHTVTVYKALINKPRDTSDRLV